MTVPFPIPRTKAAPDLCCALRRANRLSQARIEARYAEADLSFSQGSVLRWLRVHGAQSLRELAQGLGIRPVAATRIAEGLELRGLLERDPRSTARNPMVVLTLAGIVKMDQIAAEIARRWRCIHNGLSDAELDQLIALLGKLSDAIDPNLAQAPKEA
ncbi:MAG TPA: MarR family winged helix-turn-helix transcriptional regulator [Sphingomonas sp.]|uniref:MarR family winged helix-turn-helix transcriptional regulator n=1 Tax=Sphingomonas sp. TaxID=28214 RepID=UPI002B671E63|nr:MarR family winged helix-turn-helix transcriptional regulator [Sphingomonas sp.]HMI20448.1 MarR family winged helix-turn-helix transcriptional regulator [Sphingomonas sp.]